MSAFLDYDKIEREIQTVIHVACVGTFTLMMYILQFTVPAYTNVIDFSCLWCYDTDERKQCALWVTKPQWSVRTAKWETVQPRTRGWGDYVGYLLGLLLGLLPFYLLYLAGSYLLHWVTGYRAS